MWFGTRKLIARPFMVRLPNGEMEKIILPAGFQAGDAAQVCFLGTDLKEKVSCSALADLANRQGARVVEVRSSTFAGKGDKRLPSNSKPGTVKKRAAAAAAAAAGPFGKLGLPFGKLSGGSARVRGEPQVAAKKAQRQAMRKEASVAKSRAASIQLTRGV